MKINLMSSTSCNISSTVISSVDEIPNLEASTLKASASSITCIPLRCDAKLAAFPISIVSPIFKSKIPSLYLYNPVCISNALTPISLFSIFSHFLFYYRSNTLREVILTSLSIQSYITINRINPIITMAMATPKACLIVLIRQIFSLSD